ncbi:GNAT family N-acetyltransferase [uncultured Desulfovibrio sp.]|uniref:GNAT family N-acetyltransferase n=1 Tax=uncultured Desulfovibrio sp. TaxID=167968 RepID=UPI002621B207|nr:GNAT family N-acetyltransferase [uncultured Desulfovibrio sp.]
MADPVITRVDSDAALTTFVELPLSLYPPDSLWSPGLFRDDRKLLTPGRHPFWDTARRELFLAWRDGVCVGRIAAIVDEKYNAYARTRCGAFGFFECRQDREAAHALLNAARQWLAEQGMAYMRGPLNPSTNYTCGLLVDGFDQAPAIMMPWNPPYYAELLESWHLRKEQDLFAYGIRRDQLELAPWLLEEIGRLKAEGRFSWRTARRATLAQDIRAMLDIYRESWAENFAFVPLSAGEADELVNELKTILNREFFVLFFHDGQPVAGMVALPDLGPLLRRLRGRLGLSVLWHWWQARAEMRGRYRLMLFGIRPQFRLMGLPLLLLDCLLTQAQQHPDFQQLEGSWVLEDNTAIDDLIEDFSGRITKRYRLYRREITA